MNPEQRLADLGLALPTPATPIAAYLPVMAHNGLLYVSGQLPFRGDGTIMQGQLGESANIQEGVAAAQASALMVLAQASAAAGGINNIGRILKLTVFVASIETFYDQPKVANGASDLMEKVFGEAGRHTRSAVGVASLPMRAMVEVDAIIAILPESAET